jgi:DNA topoisomerase-1
MTKNLVIVESPAKAKTIEKYLGSDYVVKSSLGHVRDLPKKGFNIDIKNGFEPSYEVNPDKKKVVAELKKLAKGKQVWLATDEDREGEAIAWHLCVALGLDPKKTKRIAFHEITKSAIEQAVKNPRTVDMQLVDAQQARRALDRIVGYELSPVLWKKVRPGLSAGRVQSVAVRLIQEREREIKDYKPQIDYKITADFKAKSQSFPAELSERLSDEKASRKFLQDCAKASFTAHSINQKPGTRNPSAPFTTSSLQQEAARKLGFSVRQTMTLAQRLYENGHITYMRTDSTIISGQAIKAAETYIKKEFGEKYWQVRQYKTKDTSAQEAHEAIRPTSFNKTTAGQDKSQEKLYQLIWRRALASQMAAAEVDRTEIIIGISNRSETFVAKGEILKFDGFFKVYGGTKDDVILPSIAEGDELKLSEMAATQTFSKPPARFSEASLVSKLEDLGIGRPSTYAPTISTIQTRGYVEKGDKEGENREIHSLTLKAGKISDSTETVITGADKNKLFPTSVAEVTTDFLVNHFVDVLDYDFTKKVEEDFDNIAEGKESRVKMLGDFYKKFHPLIKKGENVSREETSQARVLGHDPKSGKPVIVRFGRYGPMLQRGEAEDEEKPDFAPLPEGVEMDEVTFKQAMEMFKLPRRVGATEDGQEIIANIGRFGPYIKVDKLFVSIKDHDPMKITEEEAREFYADKLKKEKAKYIAQFDSGISIINGPYGPYVTDGKKNARIPKETDPKKITEAQAKEMIEKAPAKKKRFKRT